MPAVAPGKRGYPRRLACAAELSPGAKELRQLSQRANLPGRRWTGLCPGSLMPIHPDRGYAGRLGPRHVELGGVTDEDRLLGSDPGESQRLTKNLGVGFGHAEFFGDKDEVNQLVD